MIAAGILAGGSGSRMGKTEKPKQFLLVSGKPIIIYSIEAFLKVSAIERVIIAVSEQWREHMSSIIAQYIGEGERISLAASGCDRNESICGVISEARRLGMGEGDMLITHDGCRPFVSSRIIEDNIICTEHYGASDTVLPATDTITVSLDGKELTEIPNRSVLYSSATPQGFYIGDFEKCYSSLSEEQKTTLTDACKIFLLCGRRVGMVVGDTKNIKITTPTDLVIAEAIAAAVK